MNKKVEIIERQDVFHQSIFTIEAARLRYETFTGGMSAVVNRLNLKRGDGAAAILYDPDEKSVVMVEQFRFPAHDHGEGWLLELPAGIMEAGDDPLAAIKREIKEETGYQVDHLQHISTFYTSPGGSSERIFLYYATVNLQDRVAAGGGLIEEHEDLRVTTHTLTALVEKIQSGAIRDAKTIIGLQWLQLHQQTEQRSG